MTPNLVAASSIAPEEVLPVTDINPNLQDIIDLHVVPVFQKVDSAIPVFSPGFGLGESHCPLC